jgi:uncharacterized protein (TIGR02466 family)
MKLITATPIVYGSIFHFDIDVENNYIKLFEKENYLKIKKYDQCSISSDNFVVDKYPELKNKFFECIKYLINNILFYKNNFFITRSWLTKTEPQGSSEGHVHSNSWLSGVYYPEYDEGHQIRFYNDVPEIFGTTPNEYNIWNSLDWTFTPKKNNLIIFSSRLRHKILTNNSLKTRYSLAFNILPNGTFGNGDSEVAFNFKERK